MSNNSEIINLYEETDKSTIVEFGNNVESKLNVKTDYEKVIKDTEWISMINDTIQYIDNILRNPNRFIINEEEIVKIELARKITVESIKHLSKNTNFIQDINKKTGDVRPSKILNINKEESYDTYENRFIYSLIQNMKFFLNRRKNAIEQTKETNNKNNKKIDYTGSSKLSDEKININISLNTELDTEAGKSKDDKSELLEKISKLETKISDLTSSEVYKIIDKRNISLITSPIKKTNVILKNVNFQYAVKLWNFLQNNLEDKTKNINEKNDYEDEGSLKKLIDESFFLNYLILNTIDKSKEDEEEIEEEKKEKEKIKDDIIDKLIERIIDMNEDISEEEIKERISNKYAIIKYKKIATIQEIQDIFSKHMDKYLSKIN